MLQNFLLKLSDKDLDEIIGLVKEEVMEDADPGQVDFLEHLEYHDEQLASNFSEILDFLSW